MIDFIKIQESDAAELAALAEEIWRDHYYDIEDKELTDYLIATFQSEEAIKKQLAEGYRYYYVRSDCEIAGYIAFYPKEIAAGKEADLSSFGKAKEQGEETETIMYLSKFYLKKEFRGRGISKEMADFIKCETKKEGIKDIFLNVNRNNESSVSAYEHLGFEKVQSVDADAGDGYIARDYIMKMSL